MYYKIFISSHSSMSNISGVAVLSMSAELAASELKELFLKIHYFGRKINFTRTKKEKQLDVSEVCMIFSQFQ